MIKNPLFNVVDHISAAIFFTFHIDCGTNSSAFTNDKTFTKGEVYGETIIPKNLLNEGIYTTGVGDTWYSFSPDSSGIFQILGRFQCSRLGIPILVLKLN